MIAYKKTCAYMTELAISRDELLPVLIRKNATVIVHKVSIFITLLFNATNESIRVFSKYM